MLIPSSPQFISEFNSCLIFFETVYRQYDWQATSRDWNTLFDHYGYTISDITNCQCGVPRGSVVWTFTFRHLHLGFWITLTNVRLGHRQNADL